MNDLAVDRFIAEYVPPGVSATTLGVRRGVVYIEQDITAGNTPDRAVFLCPCGCAELYQLHIDERDKTHPHWWKVTVADGKPTLHPSVNFTAGCLSHFHITDGAVLWCDRAKTKTKKKKKR